MLKLIDLVESQLDGVFQTLAGRSDLTGLTVDNTVEIRTQDQLGFQAEYNAGPSAPDNLVRQLEAVIASHEAETGCPSRLEVVCLPYEGQHLVLVRKADCGD